MPNIMDYLFGSSSAPTGPARRKMYEDDHQALLRRQRGEEPPQVGWDNYAPQQGPGIDAFRASQAEQNYRNSVGGTRQGGPIASPQLPQQQVMGDQQGPSMDAYLAYRKQLEAATRQKVSPETGPLWASEGDNSFTYAREDNGPSEIQKAQERQSQPPAPFPESYQDWSWWDVLRNPFTSGGEEAYRKARAHDKPAMPEDGNSTSGATLPDGGFMPEGYMNPEAMPAPEDPVAQPDDQGNAVETNPLDDIIRQKATIDSLYPQMPAQDIGQSAIDAETDKEKQRANYLAQLAFFSGITQGAGGQWEGVGKGLAGAGAAYSSGFDRYQKALAGRAKRQQDAVNAQYEHDTAKTDAAIKLYDTERKAKKDELSETRQSIKDRQSDIDEYFKERLGLAKGNDYTLPDQAKVDQILTDWRLSRQKGEIVSTQDVSDK